MRIGFVVNDVKTELAGFTTTRLAMTAARLGHETWHVGVADFIYSPEDTLQAVGRRAAPEKLDSLENFLHDMQREDAPRERITINDLDVLMLRNDPAEDQGRPWAQTAPILFGQMAIGRGVIVLNDPERLGQALSKTYFQQFPRQVRPRTSISRNVGEVKQFIESHDNDVVIKPLQGSGGHSVFLVREKDHANLNQMIEAVMRDGYCIVQEYLPGAAHGDVRLFVLNGKPLMHEGQYAAFRRVNKSGDMRSNMHSGGESEPVEVTPTMLELVEMVRPKLMRDGMYLVGLDIVDDKLMEINVFSPGGLGSAQRVTGIDFAEIIIADLERKLKIRDYYGDRIANHQIATL